MPTFCVAHVLVDCKCSPQCVSTSSQRLARPTLGSCMSCPPLSFLISMLQIPRQRQRGPKGSKRAVLLMLCALAVHAAYSEAPALGRALLDALVPQLRWVGLNMLIKVRSTARYKLVLRQLCMSFEGSCLPHLRASTHVKVCTTPLHRH